MSQERDEIVENVVAAVNGAVEIVPKKWGNVRSLHLKALESVALPIYQAVPEMGLKIDVFRKEDGVKKVGLEHGVGEEEEEKEKKKKKVVKKGRIHEVRYMDSHAEELMANMAEDDSEGEANPNEEFGVVEVKENKKKKNKKTRKMDGGGGEGEGEANETDELVGVKTTDKVKMAKKKVVTVKSPKKSAPIVDDSDSKAKEMGKKMAKKKVLESMLSKKTAKLVEDGSVGLENGSSGADVVDSKMKKRRKAEVAEGKEKKIKKK